MVSGLAPGKEAETLMVARVISGKVDTGKNPAAKRPESTTPMVRRVVAIGRWIKRLEKFILTFS
jgi:hypothetical protein